MENGNSPRTGQNPEFDVLEDVRTEEPKLYKVIILNDDSGSVKEVTDSSTLNKIQEPHIIAIAATLAAFGQSWAI